MPLSPPTIATATAEDRSRCRQKNQQILAHARPPMMHAVTTGRRAAEKVAGMPVFEYLASNKELCEIFNNA
jgi:hypothetical protein